MTIGQNYAVCVPYYGGYDPAHYRGMKGLKELGVENLLELHGCPYIDVARSVLVEQALGICGCDGVMFIDHDIVFQPRDVLKVIELAEETQALVGVPYSMRTPGKTVVGGFAPGIKDVVFFEGGGLYPSAYLGMGFTAIPRSAFDAVGRSLPDLDAGGFMPGRTIKPYFALDTSGGYYSGEDISFCRRATEANVHQFLYTVPRIFHKGAYQYGIEDAGISVPRFKTVNGDLSMTEEQLKLTRLNELEATE
jgi:hypothetical protein